MSNGNQGIALIFKTELSVKVAIIYFLRKYLPGSNWTPALCRCTWWDTPPCTSFSFYPLGILARRAGTMWGRLSAGHIHILGGRASEAPGWRWMVCPWSSRLRCLPSLAGISRVKQIYQITTHPTIYKGVTKIFVLKSYSIPYETSNNIF